MFGLNRQRRFLVVVAKGCKSRFAGLVCHHLLYTKREAQARKHRYLALACASRLVCVVACFRGHNPENPKNPEKGYNRYKWTADICYERPGSRTDYLAVAQPKRLSVHFFWRQMMQVKVYIPQGIEIPNEYLQALTQRVADRLGDRAGEVLATRGHLVRQAVQDGLLREFDELVGKDGTVDLVCDPGTEAPLELENKTLSLPELLEALQCKGSWPDQNPTSETKAA